MGAIDLRAAAVRKARESARVKEAFFEENAERVAACARAMAAAFDAGGRLFAMGNGGSACDAQHVAVEFMHPIVEKRRALPAIALPGDAPLLTAIGNDEDFALVFARQLRLLARAGDMALGLSTSGQSSNVHRALLAARELGMTTVGFAGKDGGRMRAVCDHFFCVPSFSTHRIQEAHETLLHVLWDLIHVVLGEEDVI
jgi:D-sedoheptulose 7-phosphate isomerase